MSTIQERCVEIVVDKLCVDKSECSPDADIREDLGADSIDLVEIIMEAQREFECRIPDERAEEIRTIRDLAAAVR